MNARINPVRGSLEHQGIVAPATTSKQVFNSAVESGFKQGLGNKFFRSGITAFKNYTDDEVLGADQLNEEYGTDGLVFDKPMSKSAAEYLTEKHYDKLGPELVIQKSLEESGSNYIPMLTGSFLGGMLDFGELGLGIASGGLATTALGAKVGLGISSTVLRSGYRGAAFGVGESVFSEVGHHQLSSYLNEKYTWQDTMMNVGFAMTLGGAIGAGAGKFGNVADLEVMSPATLEKLVIDQAERLATFRGKSREIEIFAQDGNILREANTEFVDSHIAMRRQQAETEKGGLLDEQELNQVNVEAEYEAVSMLREKASVEITKNKNAEKPKEVADKDDVDALDNPDSPEFAAKLSQSYDESAPGITIEKPKVKDVEGVDVEDVVDVKQKRDDLLTATAQVTESLFPSTKTKIIAEDLSDLPEGFNPNSKGAYNRDTGEIVINGSLVSNPKDAAIVVLHETIGHKGLESNFKDKDSLAEFLGYVRRVHKKELSALKKSDPSYKSDDAVLELVARVANDEIQSPRLFESLVAHAKHKMGIDPSKPFNSRDDILIRDALTRGYLKLRKGDVAQGALRSGYAYMSEADAATQDALARSKRESIKLEKEKYQKIFMEEAQERYTQETPGRSSQTETITIGDKEYNVDVHAGLDARINNSAFNSLMDQFGNELDADTGPRILRNLESSVDKAIKQLSAVYNKEWLMALDKDGLNDFFTVKDNIRFLYRAAAGQDTTDEAKKVFEILRKLSKKVIRRQNRAGGRTAILSDHIIPRFYSKNRLAKQAKFLDRWGNVEASKEAKQTTRQMFVDYMMGNRAITKKGDESIVIDGNIGRTRIDIERVWDGYGYMPDNDEVEKYLSDVFNSIWEGKEIDGAGGTGSSKLADRAGRERKIHFRTGDDAFEFDQVFGISDTASGINNMIDSFSRNTVLMENFGVNPKNMIQKKLIPALGKVANKTDNDEAAKGLADVINKIDSSFSVIDPTYRSTDNPTAAKIVSDAKQITNLTSLGGLLFTSASDMATVAHNLNTTSIDTGYLGNFFKLFNKTPQDRLMMQNSLSHLEAAKDSVMSRIDPENPGVHSKLARVTHKFFGVIGMNWWNKTMRMGQVNGFHKNMGQVSQYSLDDLRKIGGIGELIAENIQDSGITDLEWKIISKASTKFDENGVKSKPTTDYFDTYLTRDMVNEISDADIKSALLSQKKSTDDISVQRYKDKLTSKYDSLVRKNMDRGVLTPGVTQKRLLNLNQLEGSTPALIGGMMLQYKSFPLTMHQEIIAPAIGQAKKGNWKGVQSVMAMAATGTAIQMAAMQMRETLSGRTMRDWNDPQFWFEAFIKAGGAGIVADLFKDYSEYDVDIRSILFGPTTDMVGDLLGLGVQAGKSAVMEDETGADFLKNLAKVGKRMTPLGNAPLLIMLRDGVYRMTLKQLSPETLDRANNFYMERGQEQIMGNDNLSASQFMGLE